MEKYSSHDATQPGADVSGSSDGSGPPVIVGGCPRSGTTLLRSMLNSHPHLAVPHETAFIVPLYRKRDSFGDLADPDNRRKVAEWIVKDKKSRNERLKATPEELVEAALQSPPTLGSILAACFALNARNHGKPRWGDKRPSHAWNLNAIFDLFPDAQYVNVIRDPRACAASMNRVGWSWGGVESATEMWQRAIVSAEAWRRKLPREQYLDVYYEELVRDPRTVLGRVCAFLGLDPAGIDSMLEYHQDPERPTGTPFKEISKPVTTESMHSWESQLSGTDVALIEEVVGEEMRRHGYEPTGTRVPVPKERMKAFRRIRSSRSKQVRKRQLVEVKRMVTYRRPSADQTRGGS
ncbi:sulfotransferase family protein [Actinocorallia populi]|uniref:sulfotransferase family protein n=1 Tax=Actinocorallia populi TaxID=2079200 RepID=UPI000D097C0A|nr:sulfotransferase [Actinocorallia populi]